MWYSLVVAGLSLLGAAVPLRFRPGHAQLQLYLSLAAGALLGAALFHLLPESSEHIHAGFGLPAVFGVMVVFFLQRYVAPHSHEVSQGGAGHDHHDSECHAHHDPAEPARPHGPFLGSLVAIFSLSVHSLFDGIAIGAATGGVSGLAGDDGTLALAVFLSVLIHKPLDGLSVSVLLLHARVPTAMLWLVQLLYAALVPAGAAAFLLTRGAIADASPLVGYTLAFSAGTFLAIALTDLLPELHFHRHDRHKLSAALLAGLVVMWLTSLIGHGDHAADVHPTDRPQDSHAADEHAGHQHD
ncbi:MAG: ZIP family metal transporter [Planctomycetes bacterium]|nr:ZIP family metal transporter [Planctomycetota bacterium]